jgi:hypothetical protein
VFVDAVVEGGMSALLQLIEAGNGKSVIIKVDGEVWEVGAKKIDE